jgi:hypothetical protein
MSHHVHIAREGFKDDPIPDKEWKLAIQDCDDLIFKERRNEKGDWNIAILKSDNKQHLNVTPNGLMFAQNPSKELVKAMFNIASVLNANVYSERNKPYESVEDWEKRTKKYRENRERRIREYKRNIYKRKPFWVILAIFLGLLFWFLNG